MRTRQLLTVVAVTALLVTGGAVAALQAAPVPSSAPAGVADAQTQPTDESTIQVGASGSVETQPDKAVLRVSVVVRGDNVSTVRRQLSENVSMMRGALEGMDGVSLRSTGFEIEQNFRARERSEEPAYVGRHSFEVTVDDPSKAGTVVVAAVDEGGARVEGIRYTISEQTREELRNEALSEAMGSARTQAETIAEESNVQIRGVVNVRTTEVRAVPVRQEVAFASDGGAGAETSIDAGQVTVTAQVVVTYEVV